MVQENFMRIQEAVKKLQCPGEKYKGRNSQIDLGQKNHSISLVMACPRTGQFRTIGENMQLEGFPSRKE
jgi:hypothetical protein